MTASSPASDGDWEWLRDLWERDWLKGLLLVVAVLAAYQPAWRGQFVWDDGAWVLDPSRHGLLGLLVMWCQPAALQQYYPLTATTFWIDYHLWGYRTFPYHVENVLLHAGAALLFCRLLRRLEVPGAWLAAAIFALHPLMVESVAWVAERKNILSLILYLGAVLAYLRCAPGAARGKCQVTRTGSVRSRVTGHVSLYYGLAFFLFTAALLAKITAFSLPATLLLLAWWKKGRLRWHTDVLPTLPFFAVMTGLGLVTAWLETHHVGARGPDWDISLPARCLIAGRAIWFYAGKLFWPENLCFVYPRWQLDPGSLWQWLYPVTALGALIALSLARGRIGRGPAAAAFFFVGTLFPVLGFLNAYYMCFSFVCDHLAYLSSLGLIASGAALAVRASEKFRTPGALRIFAAVVLPGLAILTWRQSRMYAGDETLWRTALARNPESFLACNNLGHIILESGRVDDAIPCFQRALEIKPNSLEAYVNLGSAFNQTGRPAEAIRVFLAGLAVVPTSHYLHYDLGNVLLETGRTEEAIAHFRTALEIEPDFTEAHNNLGNALKQTGRTAGAIAEYQRALELNPLLAGASFNLGIVLLQSGRVDEAMGCFQRTVQIDPNYADAYNNLGLALLQKGLTGEAIDNFQKTLGIQPDHPEAHIGLGIAFLRQQRAGEAVVHFQKALEIQPGNIGVRQRLAWVLATAPDAALRNGARAVELAERADQLSSGNNPAILGTLAAAYAEAGRFPEAVKTARRAQSLAAAQNNTVLVDALQAQMGFYQAGSAFRDTGQTNVPAHTK